MTLRHNFDVPKTQNLKSQKQNKDSEGGLSFESMMEELTSSTLGLLQNKT